MHTGDFLYTDVHFGKGVILIKRNVSAFGALILVFVIAFTGCKGKSDSIARPSETKTEVDNMEIRETGMEAIEANFPSEKQAESSGEKADVVMTTQNAFVRIENTLERAYSLAQDSGYNGSIQDWITEATVEKESQLGKSAYQIATENGYKGSQTEWIDQLLKTDSSKTTDGSISSVSVTDSGHVVVTIDNGTTIETEDVITPSKTDTVAFTVTFLDVDGAVCKVQQVIKGNSATAPIIEKPEFLGWEGNYINVQKDEAVKAVYSDRPNVFQVVSAQGDRGDTVTTLVRLDGQVELCGFDMVLTYDPALKLVSINDAMDLDVVVNVNKQERTIRFNFSSATNKKRAMDVMELTFRITNSNADAHSVQLSSNAVKKLVDNRVENTNYTTLNGVIYVHG